MKHLMIATAVVLVVTGCRLKHTDGTSQITAGAGGREITVIAKGPAFVQPSDDAFTVTFTSHKVVIEKERLLLDGKEVGKVPATAKKFELVTSNATLRVTADGAEVLAVPLGK